MSKGSGDEFGKDVCDMQKLAARENGIGSASAADGDLPAAASLAVPAAAIDVRELRDGGRQGCGGAARVVVRVYVPIRTGTGLNDRGHWRAKARKVKAERQATAWATVGKRAPAVPCVVLLTRAGPSNGLDDDNLRGSLKAVRDEIAAWLGVDDRSPLVTWAYEQRRAKAWAVEVEIR